MSYTIEKEIPFPGRREKTGMSNTMRLLEVGDSFLASTKESRTAYALSRYLKMKITIRPVGDGKSRIWRTA